MIEAYRSGVSLVLDQSQLVGPLAETLRVLERVQGAADAAGCGLTADSCPFACRHMDGSAEVPASAAKNA
jgi:hypothetical protein